MDVYLYYLKQGVWDILELLYKNDTDSSSQESVEKLIWEQCIRTDHLRFPTQLVVSPWQQRWLAANVLYSAKLPAGADADILKREIEFQQVLDSLLDSDISRSVVTELCELHSKVQLADKVKQSAGSLSQESHDFLHSNLLVNSVATHTVIQNLLCLWSPHFTDTDTQLQDLYKEVLWACIQRIEQSREDGECGNGKGKGETERTLLCLLSILQVSEAKQLGLSDWVSTRLRSLCSAGLVPLGWVHLTLLSRGTFDFLKVFTSLEDDACCRGYTGTDTAVLESICRHIGDGHIEELFYRTVNTRRHWVEDVTAICSSLLVAGREEVVNMCMSQPGLSTLWPLLLLYTWREFSSSSEIFSVLDKLLIRCKEEVSDPTLKQMTAMLEDQVNVVRWCKLHNSGLTMSNSSLLELAKDHSILEVIRRTTNLTALNMSEVRELLSSRSLSQGGTVEPFANTANWQVIIFDGFCIMMYAFSIIQSGMEIEEMGKKLSRNCEWLSSCDDLLKLLKPVLSAILFRYYPEVHQSGLPNTEDNIKCMQQTYEEKVVKPLDTMQQMICNFLPFNFRVELLENIFSLLFLRFEDLQNESSSESGSDGEEADMASLVNKDESVVSKALSTATTLGDVFGNMDNVSAPLSDIPLIKVGVSESLYSDAQEHHSSNVQQPTADLQIPQTFSTGLLHLSSTPPLEVLSICRNRSDRLQDVLDVRRKSSYVYNSSKSTSESSCARTNQGFLCSKFIVRDMLHCLKTCIVNTSLSLYNSWSREDDNMHFQNVQSSVRPEALQKRLNRLSQYVSEAGWRLELLTDTQFTNSVGKYSDWNTTHAKENVWIYQNDESTSESDGEASSTRRTRSSRNTKRGATQDLEKSSSSGGYSLTTGGSSSNSHRKMKWSKRYYQHVVLPQSHTNIVRLMLSSQSSLAIRCLTQGDHVKARDVIQKFDVEGNYLVAEVKFTEAYQNLRSQLETCCSRKDHSTSGSSELASKPTLTYKKSIENVASGVVQSSSLANLLENFLSIVTLPDAHSKNILDAEGGTVLEGVTNPQVIVAVDLALTLGSSYYQSVSLLDVACRRCPQLQNLSTIEQPVSSRKKKSLLGFLNFTCKAICLLKEVNVEAGNSKNRVIPTNMSLRDLLLYVQYPLNIKSLQGVLSFWNSMYSACQDFVAAMAIENERKQMTDTVPASEAALKNVYGAKVNTTFRALLKVQKQTVLNTEGEEMTSSHLPNLYMYLKLLTSLWVQHCPSASDYCAPVTYFDIFEEPVMKFVGRLVFEYGVPPMQLEPAANRLNLNLVYKVVQNCCPRIPSALSGVFDHVSDSLLTKSLGVTILNQAEQVWTGSARHPETCVKVILTSVIDILKKHFGSSWTSSSQQQFYTVLDDPELVKVLAETSELTVIDLELLTSVNEALTFLINMRNLMWLHCAIAPGVKHSKEDHSKNLFQCQGTSGVLSSCQLEQHMAMKCVGYNVGQLGFVSLYNLQLLLLGRELTHPASFPQSSAGQNELLNKLNVSSDPRIVFSLTYGQADSPKVQVMSCDNIDAQLDAHMSEYLNHFVHIEESNVIKQLVISTLVQRYHEYVLVNQEPESYTAEPDLLDVADTSSLHRWEKLSWLLEFLKDNTTGQLRVQLCELTDMLCGDVVVSVGRFPGSGIMLEYSSSRAASKEDLDEEYSENLELAWQGQVVLEPVLQFLERHCWLLAVLIQKIYGQEYEADSRTWCLERLCSVDWLQCLVPVFCDNAIICALHTWPESSRLWGWLQELVDAHEWVNCVQVLRALPQARLLADLNLQTLLDTVLCELAASFPSTDCPCPWQYCQQVQSASVRAQCVLGNMSKWPVGVCVVALRALAEELPNSLPPHLQSDVDRMLRRILVYEKILTGYQFPKISSWYELSYFSTSDPGLVMEHLIESDLCVEWAELHDIPTRMPHLIDHRYIALLLKQNSVEAMKLLESLPEERTIAICNKLIEEVKNIAGLKIIVNLLLSEYVNQLPPESVQKYQELLIGVHMLLTLLTKEQVQYVELVRQPQLIVEEFLMNTRLEVLELMLTAVMPLQLRLPEDSPMSTSSVDDLLRKYATKSLEMGGNQTRTSSKSDSREDHLLVSLAGNDYGSSGDIFIMPDQVPAKSEWMPDDEVVECKCCDAVVFSMFNRRHHCRRCGRVICAACSTHRMQVLGYGNVAVRVCDNCFEQTEQGYGNLAINSLSECALQFELRAANSFEQLWRLTTEEVHNQTVRDEFGFEHAPSVSLCLAILKLHSDNLTYARFLLNACKSMMQQLWKEVANRASMKMCSSELDFSLIIKMVRSLATAAKVKFSQLGSIDECDHLLDETDLLALLVEHDCTKFIPPAGLSGSGLRKVRDRLVEEELWIPAIDISTKAGLDRTGIWAAWGKTCLRTGCWEQARDKFSHCLEVAADPRPLRNPPLLTDIIEILEAGAYPMDSQVSGSSPSIVSSPAIMHTLSTLKDIMQGTYLEMNPASSAVIIGPKIEPLFYAECKYYLDMYGSHAGILKFYMTHDDMLTALRHVITKKVEPDIFYEQIYIPCLQLEQLSELHYELCVIDPNLTKWKTYLKHVCLHLERHKLLNVLYQLQLFMKDYVRAAMTCIRFYQDGTRSYTDLAANQEFLRNAKNHLEAELGRRNVDSSQLAMKLDPRELNRHIGTVVRQLEVTKFLCDCEREGQPVPQLAAQVFNNTQVPTLFGNTVERIQLAVLVILSAKYLEEGFGIAFRIIQDYHLNSERVYCLAGRKLASDDRVGEIEQLIGCICSSGHLVPSSVCDEVLASCIQVLAEKPCLDAEILSRLMKLIKDIENKISAYIVCGQLKSAYLLAVKYNRLSDVRRILHEAERLGQTKIKQICLKRLNLSTDR